MFSEVERNAEQAERLRDQEALLILLNVGILLGLIAVHLVFAWYRVLNVWFAVSLFAGRLLMQLGELAWLRGRFGPVSPTALRRYAAATVWVHVAFASVASWFAGIPDSHYTVLLVLPTVAAAFRRSWTTLAAVVVIASISSSVYVGLIQHYESPHERLAEFFEASTDALTYIAVAMVVRTLVLLRRKQQERLRASMDALEQARDQLVREEKLGAIGRLAAGIAHEIRNPVGMIASAVALAERPGCSAADRDEMCGIVAQECRRLEKLTTDFLSFARQSPPNRAPTSIRTTLEYVAGLVRPRATEKGLSVDVDCPGDASVPLDAAQIQQALLNLSVNAIDATPKGGRIALGAEYSAAGVALTIENGGAAIPDDVRTRLFEPFFTTRSAGTGLGLAISLRIARAHGGELALTANEPGRVRFSLSIPIKAAEECPDGACPHGPNPDC